jgi:hypothetical protein
MASCLHSVCGEASWQEECVAEEAAYLMAAKKQRTEQERDQKQDKPF